MSGGQDRFTEQELIDYLNTLYDQMPTELIHIEGDGGWYIADGDDGKQPASGRQIRSGTPRNIRWQQRK